MEQPTDTTSHSLEYSTLRPRWAWKAYVLGIGTTPVVYLLLYTILRVTGVFHTHYSQGSWEIEGGTGVYVVDAAFFPPAAMEGDLQNWLRWLPEPTGG
jgi:hypothetical protein